MIRAAVRKHFPTAAGSSAFTLDLDFEAASGVTVLFGPSGSGKTLTLDSIAGFVRPDQGRIQLEETLLFDSRTGICLTPQKRRCGYVFQNYALFPHMTLHENLDFAARGHRRLERHRVVSEMLQRFHLETVAGRRPHEVSGGQKQRCSIARALIGVPKVLLLDEPARGLDAPLREELYAVLRQVRRDFQTPVLLVTHDLDECFELGEEVLILSHGRIVQRGSPVDILEQPSSVEVARLLGRFSILRAQVLSLDPGNDTTGLRAGELEITGPYLPGRLLGDRLWLLLRPERVRAFPRDGAPGPRQLAAELTGIAHKPQAVRLDFRGGISAEIPRSEFDKHGRATQWVVEFPPGSIAVLEGGVDHEDLG